MSGGPDYPLNAVVGELETLVGKGQWLAIAVDLARQLIGEDTSREELQAFFASRLDILRINGLVPRSLPARISRQSEDGAS